MTLEVALFSLGTTVRLIQVNLAFDGLKLVNPSGSPGTELPLNWFFTDFTPTTGGALNFFALDLAGVGKALDGPIFSATFTVDGAAPAGDVLVSVDFEDVRDDSNNVLSPALTPGAVKIRP